MGNTEHPSALLTKAQRRYLDGENLSGAEERAMRSRIRERLEIAFDDLRLILNSDAEGWQEDVDKVLVGVGAGRVWPLPALLFRWSIQHPTIDDLGGLGDLAQELSASDASSLEGGMDWITASFDREVERGVRAALETLDLDQVPEDVSNDLSVSLTAAVADMTDEDLADLPRRTLDLLFRKDDLDRDRYARVVELKLKPEDNTDE